MNEEQAGPSGIQPPNKGFFACFKRNNDMKDEKLKVSILDPKEKENKIISDFHFLKMNSQFITGFQTGYQMPWNGLRENAGKKLVRCNFLRRKRTRAHPYKNNSHFGTDFLSKKETIPSPVDESPYRLRTTSLSSGTGSKHKLGLHKRQMTDLQGLPRSRSMEDLSATSETQIAISMRTKDLDSVSQGIQQLHMEDTT